MKTIIFLFFPPIIKNFLLENNREKKIIFLDFDIFKDEENNNDSDIKRIEEKFKEGEEEKLILINFPQNLELLKKIQQLLLKNNGKLEKHVLLVNVTKYQVLEEIQDNYLICPLCKYLHSKKTEKNDEERSFFCAVNKQQFELKIVEEINTKILNYYLTHNKQIVDFLLSSKNGFRIIKKMEVNISETKDVLEGEIKKKIVSVIENL